MARMVKLEELQAELAKIHKLAGNTCVRIEGITWGGLALNMETKMKEPAEELPSWLSIPPDEQGLWWWWNQDPDSAAIPVQIMFGGTDNRYFASIGQYGWNRVQYVEDMGGLWMRLIEPPLPESI